MNKNFLKVVFSELVRIGTAPLRILPVKKNRILFTGLTGGKTYDYSCNPKYLYEYLRDNYPGRFEFVWAVSDKAKYSFLEEEGVKLVKHFTVSSFPMLLTSKIIVTNGSYAPWFPFRKKQYVINTWHGGGAYKKVENEAPGADWATRKRAQFCANNIDLFLASCQLQEEQMIRTTYRYQGEVLQAGTPRNDKLVKGDVEVLRQKVREQYHLPEDAKLLLYAPTYRDANPPVELNVETLKNALEQSGEQWVIMSRFHRYQEENMHIRVKGTQVIDVADYPDVQELLAATDMLITDYSSVIWDFMLLKRPCFLYVPDRSSYLEQTGFYVEMNQWPYEQATNMEELVKLIENYNQNDMEQRIKLHQELLGSYENGQCCPLLAEKIVQKVS